MQRPGDSHAVAACGGPTNEGNGVSRQGPTSHDADAKYRVCSEGWGIAGTVESVFEPTGVPQESSWSLGSEQEPAAARPSGEGGQPPTEKDRRQHGALSDDRAQTFSPQSQPHTSHGDADDNRWDPLPTKHCNDVENGDLVGWSEQDSAPPVSFIITRVVKTRKDSMPKAALSILSAATQRLVLPREEEVCRVVDSIFWRRRPRSVKQASESSCSGQRGCRSSEVEVEAPTIGADVDQRINLASTNPVVSSDDCQENHMEESEGTFIGAQGVPQHFHCDDVSTITSPKSRVLVNHDIFDQTKFNTIIRGMGGVGKTTMAALAVSHEEVLSRFRDGIGWVTLGQRRSKMDAESSDAPVMGSGLSYQDYTEHLRNLCRQLSLDPIDFDEVVFLPGDDARIREEKTSRAMDNARQDMTNLLNGKAVLIVLDDLWHARDVDWFSFANRPSSRFRLLITTRLHIHRNNTDDTDYSKEGSTEQMTRPGKSDVTRSRESVITLETLKDEEAVRLFLAEAAGGSAHVKNEPPTWSAEERRYALIIVQHLGFLPVALRSAGRLLSTWSAGKGRHELFKIIKMLAFEMSCDVWPPEPLNLSRNPDIDIKTALSNRTNKALYEVLDRSFSSELHGSKLIGRAMEVCFIMFAVVFSRPECSRPLVPMAAVHKLFEGILLQREVDALVESHPGLHVATLVLEKMESLGLVDSAVPSVRKRVQGDVGSSRSTRGAAFLAYKVHHDLMVQYALHSLKRLGMLESNELICRIRRNKGNSCGITLFTKAERSFFNGRCRLGHTKRDASMRRVIQWLNSIVVEKYLSDRCRFPSLHWDAAVPNDGYVFEHLPHHMIRSGGNNMCKRAFDLLCDDGFIRARMTSMGVEGGTKAHTLDVEELGSHIQSIQGDKAGESFLREGILAASDAVRSCLKKQLRATEVSSPSLAGSKKPSNEEVGLAFVSLGKSLQKQALWAKALDVFAEALEMFKAAGVPDTHPDVARTQLLVNAYALRLLVLVPRDSPKCVKFKYASRLKELANRDSSSEEVGDSKLHADVPLELSSHPGIAIVPLRPHYVKTFGIEYIVLGFGPKESALRISAYGKSIFRPDDGAFFTSFKPSNEGLSTFLSSPLMAQSNPSRFPGTMFRHDWTINDDGSISPSDTSDLAFGFGGYPISLVPRSSPSRFIFKYAAELRKNKLKEAGHNPTGEDSGFPLELSSHPGFALNTRSRFQGKMGPVRFMVLEMGAAEDALRVSYDGRIIGCCRDGAVLRIMGKVGTPYEIGTPAWLVRANKKSMTRWKGGVNDFAINEEGSISPMHAPNLALGCLCLGRVNDIITLEERCHAEIQAKQKPKQASLLHKYRALQTAIGIAQSDTSTFGVNEV